MTKGKIMRANAFGFAFLGMAATAMATPAATPELTGSTPVSLRLEMDLRSGQDKVGEPVLFTVEDKVFGPDHSLLLEKGALARGHVTQSSKRGAFGHDGKLTFTCDYAIARNGTHVPMFLVVEVKPDKAGEKSSTAGEIGATATAGINTNGYTQSPAYYYDDQQTGVAGAVDTAHLLEGSDETAARGQEYKAVLAASLPPSAVPLPSQVFTLKDKTQLTGTLLGFSGGFYLVKTSHGNQNILATDVASVAALPGANPH